MELAAQKRDAFGRGVKALRGKGFIPAELYGHGVKNEHVAILAKDFQRVFREAGESALVHLFIEGEKHPVFIYDVAFDPVTDAVTAVDFYQVRLDRKIKVKVPFVFEGQSPAIKDKGGVLVKAVQEVEVEALPGSIPRELRVSIANLADIGQSVYMKNIDLPEGVKAMIDLDTVVASVIAKVTEEQEAAMAATVDVGSIKAEVEEKKAERTVAQGEAAVPEGGAAPPTPPEIGKK